MEENLKLDKRFKFSVACDGGAASGKTTGAKIIAKKYIEAYHSALSIYWEYVFILN